MIFTARRHISEITSISESNVCNNEMWLYQRSTDFISLPAHIYCRYRRFIGKKSNLLGWMWSYVEERKSMTRLKQTMLEGSPQYWVKDKIYHSWIKDPRLLVKYANFLNLSGKRLWNKVHVKNVSVYSKLRLIRLKIRKYFCNQFGVGILHWLSMGSVQGTVTN